MENNIEALADITNGNDVDYGRRDAGSRRSDSSVEELQQDEEVTEFVQRQAYDIATSIRNWKGMDNNLLDRSIYLRQPFCTLDANSLQDFYRAKRNEWIKKQDSLFLSEKLFFIHTTCDIELYLIRESYIEQSLNRYLEASEYDNDIRLAMSPGNIVKW